MQARHNCSSFFFSFWCTCVWVWERWSGDQYLACLPMCRKAARSSHVHTLAKFSTSYSPHESNASCTYVLREPRRKSLFVRTLSTVFEAHKTDPVLYVHVLSFRLQYYSQARGIPELQSLFEENVNLTYDQTSEPCETVCYCR